MEKLSYKVRGAIYEVHKILGPGLYEECYHLALMRELQLRNIPAEYKVKLPVMYKGVEIKDAYEIDILVDNKIILELKSVEYLIPKNFKQLMNYLQLSDKYLGYLVNFNTLYMKDGEDIKRVFNNNATDRSDI